MASSFVCRLLQESHFSLHRLVFAVSRVLLFLELVLWEAITRVFYCASLSIHWVYEHFRSYFGGLCESILFYEDLRCIFVGVSVPVFWFRNPNQFFLFCFVVTLVRHESI